MPHVGPLKDEEGARCPFDKQQSPTEEKQDRGRLILYSMATCLVTRDKMNCIIR